MSAEKPHDADVPPPYEGPSEPPLNPAPNPTPRHESAVILATRPRSITPPPLTFRRLEVESPDLEVESPDLDPDNPRDRVLLKGVRFPRWLEINVRIAMVTACLMFALAIVLLAFAGVAMGDLKNDPDDFNCDSNYIKDASETPEGQTYNPKSHGKYHFQCRLLFFWSYILIVAGSFSMVRALLQAVYVSRPPRWVMEYNNSASRERHKSPSRIWLIRTVFSAIACALYLVSAIMLGSNRLMTGPRAWDSYKSMYTTCLALVVVSLVLSAQQCVATGLASWYSRKW